MKDGQYTIKELSDTSGYPRRTIRYYVQIGLIDSPAGRGMGGFYNDSHLNKLRQIKALKEKGINLTAIINYLRAGKVERESYARDIWARYEIIPGIEISVRRDVEEKESKKIFKIIKVAKSIARESIKDE